MSEERITEPEYESKFWGQTSYMQALHKVAEQSEKNRECDVTGTERWDDWVHGQIV